MLEEMIKEAMKAKAEAQKQEEAKVKNGMIEEMKKFTLRENTERLLGTLAHLGMQKGIERLIAGPSSDKLKDAYLAGFLACLTPACEAIQAALENSKDIKG